MRCLVSPADTERLRVFLSQTADIYRPSDRTQDDMPPLQVRLRWVPDGQAHSPIGFRPRGSLRPARRKTRGFSAPTTRPHGKGAPILFAWRDFSPALRRPRSSAACPNRPAHTEASARGSSWGRQPRLWLRAGAMFGRARSGGRLGGPAEHAQVGHTTVRRGLCTALARWGGYACRVDEG